MPMILDSPIADRDYNASPRIASLRGIRGKIDQMMSSVLVALGLATVTVTVPSALQPWSIQLRYMAAP
jgi:hypothetical protein